jgi:serine/threonine protein kinase
MEMHLIMIELCDFGALHDLLSRETLQPTNAHTIGTATVLEIGGDVIGGMVYLANQNFVHRDLAARNILYDHQQVCKVADFGLARLLADSKHYYYVNVNSNSPLPLRWSAPEVLPLPPKGKFSTKSDVWSFGVFLFEVLSRAVIPFARCSNTAVIKVLTSENVNVAMQEQFVLPFLAAESIYHELIIPCWHRATIDRIDFNSLAISCKRLVDQLGVPQRPAFNIARTATSNRTFRNGGTIESSRSGSSSSGNVDYRGAGAGSRPGSTIRTPYPWSSTGNSNNNSGSNDGLQTSGTDSNGTDSNGRESLNQFSRLFNATKSGDTTDAHRHSYQNVAQVQMQEHRKYLVSRQGLSEDAL